MITTFPHRRDRDDTCIQLDLLLPLCVDLDGTLIQTDLLLESFLALIKANLLYIFLLPFWFLSGKARLKAEIARRVTLDPAVLPYNTAFLDWLQAQKALGRSLWLCTAANERLAEPIASYLGIFDGLMASDAVANLSGISKVARLVGHFGEKGFDYCGNARVDLAIWRRAHAAIVVGGGAALERDLKRVATIEQAFTISGNAGWALFKALRPHQWAKNVLVFAPLLAAHEIDDPQLLFLSLLAFVAFGLCASSAYVFNDMLDLEHDRQHPRKCRRPFAAGELSLLTGLVLAPMLLFAALSLSLLLSPKFAWTLASYYLLTLAYSFALKHLVLVDVLTLAALYTMRIVAGSVAVAVPLSFWMLIFSVFLFLNLAMVKRYAELSAIRKMGKIKSAGRDYHIDDLSILQSLGSAAGYIAVLVLALYINSPEVNLLYRQPKAIWWLCALLLYWVSRVWLEAHRGRMHEDPVVFALKDKPSLVVGILALAVVIGAV